VRFERILIAGADVDARGALGASVRRLDLPVEELATADEVLARDGDHDRAELVLVLAPSAREGIASVLRLLGARPALACGLLCPRLDPASARNALRAGALDVAPWPQPFEELSLALERLAHAAELRASGGAACGDLTAQLANRRIEDIERLAILATLRASGGNKTEAARRLGITPRTVSNKLKIWRSAGLVA
jgi:DNA-binding NtrC family response regulator